MKKTLLAATLATLTGFAALAPSLAHADRLDDIKKAGVLRVASFDSNPPFGFVDAKASRSKASTSTTPRPWPTSSASSCKCCRPTRPTAFRC